MAMASKILENMGASMNKYLIGYTSKTGTTKEIATKMEALFIKNNIEVDVISLEAIKNIDQYNGVILGSPINGMKLLPEFFSFIESNQNLKTKTLGIFAVSYIADHGRKIWKKLIQKSLNKAKFELSAGSSAIFGGRIDKKMPGFANFIFGLSKDLPLDIRNWR
jgi:menaquinone-dependent protoporphyrinogen IX oxidase